MNVMCPFYVIFPNMITLTIFEEKIMPLIIYLILIFTQ
jgi:hypothetical protein